MVTKYVMGEKTTIIIMIQIKALTVNRLKCVDLLLNMIWNCMWRINRTCNFHINSRWSCKFATLTNRKLLKNLLVKLLKKTLPSTKSSSSLKVSVSIRLSVHSEINVITSLFMQDLDGQSEGIFQGSSRIDMIFLRCSDCFLVCLKFWSGTCTCDWSWKIA